MRIHRWISALLLILSAGGQGRSGEPPCCPSTCEGFLQRFQPVGGWHPYGGGLLHWWPRHCFPCRGGPDDYCRKPLPKVCWPPYPPYYTWGLPAIGCPQCNGGKNCNQPH